MMVSYSDVTGTQEIILLFHAVKIVNTESGISMAVSFTAHQHTIMSLQASSGHQMVITLLLALLRCFVFAISQAGLIRSTNLPLDL